MPLINIREVYPSVNLGLWQLDESEEEFYTLYPSFLKHKSLLEEHYKNETRKKEFLGVRALLHEMLGILDCELTHNADGKPLLEGYHLSISHTKGYVALIISKQREVAVDIEYVSDRVRRIASKFLRKDERAQDTLEMLVHWCGKETIYKLFSSQNLGYKEMRVKPFDVNSDWFCQIENMRKHRSVNVDFEVAIDFVLTYCCL